MGGSGYHRSDMTGYTVYTNLCDIDNVINNWRWLFKINDLFWKLVYFSFGDLKIIFGNSVVDKFQINYVFVFWYHPLFWDFIYTSHNMVNNIHIVLDFKMINFMTLMIDRKFIEGSNITHHNLKQTVTYLYLNFKHLGKQTFKLNW